MIGLFMQKPSIIACVVNLRDKLIVGVIESMESRDQA
jgi:hypothetical protein